MIRSHVHESWDYPNFGLSAPTSSNPFTKSTIDNHCVHMVQNEVSDWMEQFTKHLVDDMPETSTGNFEANNQTRANQNNFVPSISASNFNLRKPTWRTQFDPYSNDLRSSNLELHIQTNTSENNPNNHELNLITLLMECAVAISVENLGEAHRMLLELTPVASPYKPSCAERVAAYFAKAMASRVMNSRLGICFPLIDHRSLHSAFQVFNNISPFIKFAHFTSNQAILEALHGRENVHIIDLDIMQGLQWPAFLHILATRMEGPPHVQMTGMGTSMELLIETGKQLSIFAKRLGMSFKFHPIARKFGEIDASMVQVRPGETIAVHWLQHSLYDATGPDWKTLRLVEELEPRIVTLVEQDVSHGGSFLDRFVGSLHYYSTLFDSLGAYLPSEDPSRHRVEHGLLSREINNVLAMGGRARSGEEKFRQWRSELAIHRFVQLPMSDNSMAQAQLILNMFSPAHGYTLAQVDGTLRLGWKGTSLYTASAWTCVNSR
ncbi:hypothetical protein L6164_034392 [Bauhinia variegata]|uniref:Uncharacterized protein n=1 Tax=Bauhinia variegata TaxID=167791 RepID=A0ACB9KUQ4_BAUVA|nr:hypothetical protein L6164_034392 [Bauhinia variegata]